MTKRSSAALFLAVTTFFFSGCSGESAISPQPSTAALPLTGTLSTIPTDEGEPEQPVPSTNIIPSERSPLAGISPCSVVPQEAVNKRGATGPGTEEKIGLGRTYSWKIPHGDLLDIIFFDTAGAKDAVGDGPKTPVTVGTGQHDSIQQHRLNDCAISITIGNTSRVDIQVVAREADPEIACSKAKSLADEVEPHLPRQVR